MRLSDLRRIDQVPSILCPGCGSRISTVGCLCGKCPHPKPGERPLCPRCGFVFVIGADLRPRPLTLAEIDALPIDDLLEIGKHERDRLELIERIREQVSGVFR